MSAVSATRKLLAPLTPAYRLALRLREARLKLGLEAVRRLRYPVVSIGNLSTGGTGKTPLTIALAQALAHRGFHVDVLSRGYGRASEDAARVDSNGAAEQYGDEPLLIARKTGVPVYVARQRFAAGLLAESELHGAETADRPIVHLLDDGFQHRQLARAVDIVLLNREDWHDRLLPSGNLREPFDALRRAHIVALDTEDTELEPELRSIGWKGAIWRLHRTMQTPDIPQPVLAFCGVARPAQFFSGLERAGVNLAARRSFPDHHRYTTQDLQRLSSEAHAAQAAALLTTEKDMVRLNALPHLLASNLPIHTVALRIEIVEQDDVIDALLTRLNRNE